MRTNISLTLALAAGFALAATPALAGAEAGAVSIIYPPGPPPAAQAYDQPDEPLSVAVQPPATTPVEVVLVRPDRRAFRRRQALFQRYTGFRRVYSGPRYPF